MAITKIHAIKSTLSNVILYIENPSKTDGQLLVSGYNVEPQTAALDFEITAMMAHKVHHISCKKTSNLAYHLIQSFSPTEKITPREAHDLGRKLALEFTEGKYEFVIATHIDKGHIHNHIIINSVSFYDYKKLRTVPYRTAQQIRSISDRLCMEAQLSVIKDPQKLGQLYPTYVQKKRTTSNRTEVRKKLNFCLERATNYAQFLQMAQELGISVCQRGKHMTYLPEGAGRAIRDTSLADTDKFTYTGLVERLEDNAAQKDTFYKQNEVALQAYSRAASQLDKMGISLGTEPEKVRQLVTETESRIADLIAELEIVCKTNRDIQEDKEKVEQIQSG